jgi:hypothetical protein
VTPRDAGAQVPAWGPAFDHDPNAWVVGPCVTDPNPPTHPLYVKYCPPHPSTSCTSSTATPWTSFGYALGGKTVFLALHASLIPKGPDRGRLLVWSHKHTEGDPACEKRENLWSIVDPYGGSPAFQNFCQPLETGEGDLFCAGHAWDHNGDLLVVGGTTQHGCDGNQNKWGGARISYWFRPDIPITSPTQKVQWWQPETKLQIPRWYPSVLVLGTELGDPFGLFGITDKLVVIGGSDLGTSSPTYEVIISLVQRAPGIVWEPYSTNPLDFVFRPPTSFWFGDYPRVANLSNLGGRFQYGGMNGGTGAGSVLCDHLLLPVTPATWTSVWSPQPPLQVARIYGSALLLPYTQGNFADMFVSAGGTPLGAGVGSPAHKSVDVSVNGMPWPPLSTSLDMKHPRYLFNTVALPTGNVLAIGGDQVVNSFWAACNAALVPEILYVQLGGWQDFPNDVDAETIIRDYHSVALLLPTGQVMTAGGESRHHGNALQCQSPFTRIAHGRPADYQIYNPPYLRTGAWRPVLHPSLPTTNPTTPALVLKRQAPGNALEIHYQPPPNPVGNSIASAVLVRAGSVTHHADTNQRVVQLDVAAGETEIPGYQSVVATLNLPSPQYRHRVTKGYYMLFLMTNNNVPCTHAAWVKVED